ncbi:MAG: glutathione-disulfide reductase [Oligoflexales bacterium]
MQNFQYDLCVIGAGSGGVRAARLAASKGLKVAIVEERYLGGTCVNVGCVPKKLFVYASAYAEELHDAESFGWSTGKKEFSWKKLRANKDAEISRLEGIYENLLKNSGANLIRGKASLLDPNTVAVGDKQIKSKNILVATGSWPVKPSFPGSEHVVYSNEMFHLESLPKKIVIVGAGYIGLEFASILNGLGVEVSVLQRSGRILNAFDRDIQTQVLEQMRTKGVKILLNTQIKSAERLKNGSLKVNLSTEEALETELIFFATGRKPLVAGLGLENLGIDMKPNGAIKINQHYQTSVPNIYALGDVTGNVQLTPVATAEAMILVHNFLNPEDLKTLDYELIPTAVFSQPNVGTVGLTEEQAIAKYKQVDVFCSNFRTLKHSLTQNQERTFMKMIVDRKSDLVLGIHMVGHEAGEIIQGLGVALKAGASKSDFDRTIGIHPTSAEEFVTMRQATRSHGNSDAT